MSWFRTLFGRGGGTGSAAEPIRIERPAVEGAQTIHGDQTLRKAWAEDVLRAEGIPINSGLPMIESEAEIRLRTPREVADRLLALTIVAVKGEGLAQDDVDGFVRERGIRGLFTRRELAFIDDPDPDDHDRVQFSWRYEAAWILLWALKLADGQLGLPRDLSDVARLVQIVRDTPDLDRRGMQSANDILNEADLIFRCHWAVRQAGLDGAPPPAGLDPGVTMERHHALNWLIGYNDGAEWDDVTTDT